jgi:hypothetical protein
MPAVSPSSPTPMKTIERLLSTTLDSERLAEVLAAYEPIAAEIARLRELDLASVHPAVVFEPTAVYRKLP